PLFLAEEGAGDQGPYQSYIRVPHTASSQWSAGGWKEPFPLISPARPPNVQVQPPGRPPRLPLSERRHAGPVGCNGWFGQSESLDAQCGDFQGDGDEPNHSQDLEGSRPVFYRRIVLRILARGLAP